MRIRCRSNIEECLEVGWWYTPHMLLVSIVSMLSFEMSLRCSVGSVQYQELALLAASDNKISRKKFSQSFVWKFPEV